jgi:hypothetical protein
MIIPIDFPYSILKHQLTRDEISQTKNLSMAAAASSSTSGSSASSAASGASSSK